MRGGFLVALDDGLYERAARALIILGAVEAKAESDSGSMVHFTDDSGRLFTLFEYVPKGTEWEVREGPFTPAPGAQLPDMQVVTACPFECRWPDLVALIADSIGNAAGGPTWVLDGDGVLWNADSVDPMTVQL